jgi:tetratricopeptide (TPR) repeat protein
MTRFPSDRIVRHLAAAEGYLMLDLPHRALELLQARSDWATMQFEASLLTGEALRALGRFRDALKPLEQAARLRPESLEVALAQGWCYKRTHRLAQAIDALERAVGTHPDEPLLHYNLACYWSLAGNAPKALDELALALKLAPGFGRKIAQEPDFDPIRDHPEFQRLTRARAPTP